MKKTPAQFKSDRHDKSVRGVASQNRNKFCDGEKKVHKLKKQMTKIKVMIIHILML